MSFSQKNRKIRVALFNDTAINGHFGCLAVMSTIFKEGSDRGFEFVVISPTGHDWRPHMQQIKEKQIDLVVVNGEGSIHNTQRNQRGKLLCSIADFARETLKAPSVLLNSTLYNLDDATLNSLRNFTLVYTRETASKAYLEEHEIQSEWSPDLSIYSPFLKERKNKRSGILVTDSVIKTVSEDLEIFAKNHGLYFSKMLKKRKRTLLSRILLRMSGDFNQKMPEVDTALKRSHNELENFFSLVSSAELVITGRFHSCLLSLVARTPVIGINSNTPKLSYVFKDVFGSTERIFDEGKLPSIDPRDLKFNYLYSDQELESLNKYIEDGSVRKEQMFNRIAALYENR